MTNITKSMYVDNAINLLKAICQITKIKAAQDVIVHALADNRVIVKGDDFKLTYYESEEYNYKVLLNTAKLQMKEFVLFDTDSLLGLELNKINYSL